LDEDKIPIAAESGPGTQDKLRSFYVGHYGLEFVENNVEEYIKRLFDECDKKGLLRPIKVKTETSIKDEIRELIKEDQIKKAIERLSRHLENMSDQVFEAKAEDKEEWLSELDSHSGQLDRTESRLRRGVITAEVADVEKNKITESLQTIVQKFG
jgi:hypothetical protein